jgi:trk system potassium uptake protein TrkH
MSFFDAICHAMTTMPSGGFSTFNDSINGQSDYIKSIILLFMLITGTNFALHFRAVNLGLRSYQRDREFQYYILVCIFFSGLIFLTWDFLIAIENSPLDIAFQTVSIVTTTGYTSTNYSNWSPFISQYLIIYFNVYWSDGWLNKRRN